jgi:molybdopterin/thiamine biosynthesis adenylyltransferase
VFKKLVSHNDDIRQLVEKGYAVAFDSNCLIVRDIPYLDAEHNLHIGAIVSKLVFVDQEHVTQDDHQIFFGGTHPHNLDGSPLPNLAGGPTQLPLSDASKDVVVQRSFSNKPKGGFPDFFAKIESYVGIISGPAMELHGATPYTFRAVESVVEDSIFKFHDTLTSRAELADLAAKFHDDVVAIIGLGGTGAYIMDYMVKTPVKEIRCFDFDIFHVHTAFRSPGRLDATELARSKAEVYSGRYENFRHGLTVAQKFIDASSTDDIQGVTFAFVCVDKGSSRAGIFDLLMANNIPFIDVGMGLKRTGAGSLNGQARTTYYSAEMAKELRHKQLAPLADSPDNIYRVNIQISELNALNAALAVIKFKQLRGFYMQTEPIYNSLFEVCDLKIVGESGQ